MLKLIFTRDGPNIMGVGVKTIRGRRPYILGDLKVTANLHCNFAYLFIEGCVMCSIYLR